MKIGVLGSGTVGQTLAAGLLKHGHDAMIGTRDASKLAEWQAKNPKATVGTFSETARFGDLVILASLGSAATQVVELAGPDNFKGKVLVDTTNPLSDVPPVNGVLHYFTGPNESLAEIIQALVPAARVVKAFNSVGAPLMVNPHFDEGTPTMFLCGNDDAAKSDVSAIIRQFGWDPYDCGGITAARALEPLCMLWLIPGFLRNQWTHAFKLLQH